MTECVLPLPIFGERGDFSAEKGLTVVEIIEAIHNDEIKGMYILGENPAMSDPDVSHARDALAKLDILVVQDIFLTENRELCRCYFPRHGLGGKERHGHQYEPSSANGSRRNKTPGGSTRRLVDYHGIGESVGFSLGLYPPKTGV